MKRLIIKIFGLDDLEQEFIRERMKQKAEDEKYFSKLLDQKEKELERKYQIQEQKILAEVSILKQELATTRREEAKRIALADIASGQIQENHRVVGEMQVIMESFIIQITSTLGAIKGVKGKVDNHVDLISRDGKL